MEVYARDLPGTRPGPVLSGVYEVAKLLEGLPIDVWAFDEGSIFLADYRGALYEPVITISGRYGDFVEYENPMLGLLSTSTSVSTKASRFRVAAGDRQVVSFGTRRVHPALAPLIERSCYYGRLRRRLQCAGWEASGDRALRHHAACPCPGGGGSGEGVEALDETMPKEVKRTALVDTFWDEKTEAIKAYETLGKNLWGIRLDTPASRRGNFRQIIEEVKWELKIRGADAVKIFVSGRLSEEDVVLLKDIVDGFGVGTAVAYPPNIDFSAKIVEVRDKGKTYLRGKRGGLGGRKDVYRSKGYRDTVAPHGSSAPRGSKQMLRQVIDKGELVGDFRSISSIRENVIKELREVTRSEPALIWG